MIKQKGGYTLVSLMLVDIAVGGSIPGLGERLHSIGSKRVVLTDIVVSGEAKKEIPVQVDLELDYTEPEDDSEPEPIYKATIKGVYGYTLSITDGTLTTEAEKDALELEEEIGDLQEIVGDSSAGLVKKVNDLETKTSKITFDSLSSTTDVDGKFTADSIIETMSGYSYNAGSGTVTPTYAGCVKNGNKITFAIAGRIATEETLPGSGEITLGYFSIPSTIGDKLYPITSNRLADVGTMLVINLYSAPTASVVYVNKDSNTTIKIAILTNTLAVSTNYTFRFEITFLLSDNLAS